MDSCPVLPCRRTTQAWLALFLHRPAAAHLNHTKALAAVRTIQPVPRGAVAQVTLTEAHQQEAAPRALPPAHPPTEAAHRALRPIQLPEEAHLPDRPAGVTRAALRLVLVPAVIYLPPALPTRAASSRHL